MVLVHYANWHARVQICSVNIEAYHIGERCHSVENGLISLSLKYIAKLCHIIEIYLKEKSDTGAKIFPFGQNSHAVEIYLKVKSDTEAKLYTICSVQSSSRNLP